MRDPPRYRERARRQEGEKARGCDTGGQSSVPSRAIKIGGLGGEDR